jgi:hypothetical protein
VYLSGVQACFVVADLSAKLTINMKIVSDNITIAELRKMAADLFGNMVKAVVDIDRETIAVDAELHSDLEALLIENGSRQNNLWGINIHPELSGQDFVEFDSMINLRPSQGNLGRGIDNIKIREKILEIIKTRVKQ